MPVKPFSPRLAHGPLASGLVLGMPFAEGSGATVYDYSGQGNNGALNGGVTWAPGLSGSCLSFDGSSGYIQCPIRGVGYNNLTMACWAYIPSTYLNGAIMSLWGSDNYGFGIGVGCHV